MPKRVRYRVVNVHSADEILALDTGMGFELRPMTAGCCATSSSTVGTGTLRSNLADDTLRAEVTAAHMNRTNMFVGEAVGDEEGQRGEPGPTTP